MSRWIHNPQGMIIAIVRDQSELKPFASNPRRVSGGIILVVALAIAVGLMALWPSDSPAALPISTEQHVDDRLIAGVAAAIDGEDHIFALTTSAGGFEQPALTVFTADDAGEIQRIASLPAPVDSLRDDIPSAPRMTISNSTVYVPLAGEDQYALWVVDVSNPESPQEISTVELERVPGSVAVNGDLIAVGPMDDPIVRLIDASNPAQPKILGEYATRTSFADIELVGSTLYVGNRDGVDIVDVSVPDVPEEVGSWSSEGWRDDLVLTLSTSKASPRIATIGNHLFAATDFWGIEVLDVGNPADIDSPTRSLRLNRTPGRLSRVDYAIDVVATDDSTLYALWRDDSEYVVREIDVSNPGDPDVVSETGGINGDYSFQSLAAGENHVYFLNGDRIHAVTMQEAAP